MVCRRLIALDSCCKDHCFGTTFWHIHYGNVEFELQHILLGKFPSGCSQKKVLVENEVQPAAVVSDVHADQHMEASDGSTAWG